MDVPWKYLNFFLEDDTKLAAIGEEYGSGRMLTGARLGVGPAGLGTRQGNVCATALVLPWTV